jgi:pyrimidine-nucleoside phosphorylase
MSKRKTALPVAPVPELIAKKRDGGELEPAEIQALVRGFTAGDIPEYQMSALAMAIYFRDMTPEETAALTLAMRDSGTVVDMSSVRGPKVDKHSTGRGLGHTGGTLDKLEAIPGFRVDMTTEAFVRQVGEIGCALIGQTADIAPADKRLYALRDVTGTVESIPLITASILSKKLAEGIDALVLDVKVGSGAFMKTKKDARALARSIVRVGTLAKKRVSAMLTAMDQPLGLAVGNALETREAFDVLHGGGPEDLVELTMALAAEMLRLAKLAKTPTEARKKLTAAIADGSARRAMRDIIEAQGGDPRTVDDPDRLPRAPRIVPVRAPLAGAVRAIDAKEIGLASMALGAGRTRSDQAIDPAVGLILRKKLGDKVRANDTLAELHVRDEATAKIATERVLAAYSLAKSAPRRTPLVIETLRGRSS